jgi:hypothetical protein
MHSRDRNSPPASGQQASSRRRADAYSTELEHMAIKGILFDLYGTLLDSRRTSRWRRSTARLRITSSSTGQSAPLGACVSAHDPAERGACGAVSRDRCRGDLGRSMVGSASLAPAARCWNRTKKGRHGAYSSVGSGRFRASSRHRTPLLAVGSLHDTAPTANGDASMEEWACRVYL